MDKLDFASKGMRKAIALEIVKAYHNKYNVPIKKTKHDCYCGCINGFKCIRNV